MEVLASPFDMLGASAVAQGWSRQGAKMGGVGGLVLILMVLVVGSLWAVLYGPLRDNQLLRRPVDYGAQTQPQAAEDAAAPKVRTVRKPALGGSPVPQAALALEQAPPGVAPQASSAQAPAFPTAADLLTGVRGSQVIASFGPPVARTIGVDKDGQWESLIYRRVKPDSMTIVYLRNGRVISAVTTAY